MRYRSPLRYPGGKAALAGFLADVIEQNGLRGCSYLEPYAGGAGAALALLATGVVSKIHLNDADERIAAFWCAALYRSQQFAERIGRVPLTIKEWRRQNEICQRPKEHSKFDVGFAAFYMNRCNRSGVLLGSGPIGGYEQAGEWKLDVRFNREALAERVLKLGQLRSQIHIDNKDAIQFLKCKLPRGRGRENIFVYLDPPYVGNGSRLYMNFYKKDDHAKLAKYIQAQRTLRWLMSYDDTELVRRLYRHTCSISKLPIRYVLQTKRSTQELVIAPQRTRLPNKSAVGPGAAATRRIKVA